MNIESILGITASIIAIGTLAYQGFQKFQKKELSSMLTELADKSTSVKRQHRILRLMDINFKSYGDSISTSYINEFVANGRSKSVIFHDICDKNNIEPTKELCVRALGYDEPKFRSEWQLSHSVSTHEKETTANEQTTSTGVIYDWDTDFVYISDMLKVVYPEFHKRLCDKFQEMGIPYGELIGTKDIWCRDYMPIQIEKDKYVGYVYNPDYLQTEDIAFPHLPILSHLKFKDVVSDQKAIWDKNDISGELSQSKIILDGGNVVITDENILLTDKIFSENNCETTDAKMELQNQIKKTFGLNPILIPWSPNGDDVYGHTDGLVKVLPSENRYESLLIAPIFKKDRDKLHENLDKDFKIFEIEFDIRGKDFEKYAWAYINFLQVGNKILMPSFGLPCEKNVISQLQKLFPNCNIDTIEMREIADQGGALHCITWNIKK